jgi:gamma-glutamyltranspeptidase/glutathione hydrolase
MLNNMLGELELLPNGPGVLKPGERLPSNMTPMVAVRAGAVVAIGAAGADRIAPAIAQTWRGIAARRESVADAINSPRFHVRDGLMLDFEPGFDPVGVELELHPFDARHMYFGGVQATARCQDGTLAGGGDPRRGGGVVASSQRE